MDRKKLLFLIGTAMAAFLDFSVGALLATIVGSVMGEPVNIWHLIAGGILALLPDITQITMSCFKKKQIFISDHHETFDHWPILMITIWTVLLFIVGGRYWGVLTFLCMFFHYNHDMEIGNNGGIAFFAPFKWEFFTWFKGFYDPETSPIYRPENILGTWVWENWLKPSTLSLIEISLGSAALAIATSMVVNYRVSILLFAFCWIGTILVWREARS